MIIVSTSWNEYVYKLWTDAINKQNDYVLLKFIGQKFQVEMKNGKKKQLEIHHLSSFNQNLSVSF